MLRDKLLDYFNITNTVQSGEAGMLRLEDGTVVRDFLSQYGANPFGGIDPEIRRKIASFLDSGAPAICQPFGADHVARLKERLPVIAGMNGGEVYLVQSGAETVELAVKIARAASGKPCTIALDGAFHGKTTGAVALTANREYADYFGVDGDFTRRLRYGSIAELNSDFTELTADDRVNSVILELVQGEGGMRCLDPEWVRELVGLARERNILVVVDEVQTGLGRTGSLLACEQYGITPDIVLLSKSLGAGVVPIGACIAAPGVCPPEFSIYHSSTFANNNFTCFIANAFLDRLEEGIQARVADSGAYLGAQLDGLVRDHPDIFSHHSGTGLMRGLHLHTQVDRDSYVSNFFWNTGLTGYAAAGWLLRHCGVLVMPCFSCPSCLRIQPPLTADRDYIDRGLEAFAELAEMLRCEGGLTAMVAADGLRRPPVSQSAARLRQRPHRTATARPSRFQFAIHPLDERSYVTSLPGEVSALPEGADSRFSNRIIELGRLMPQVAAPCYEVEPFRLGERVVEGQFINVNATAREMLALTPRDRQWVLNALSRYTETYNASVLGLGAFTSIIAQGGWRLRHLSAAVTAGSSLTAYAAVQAAMTAPVPIHRPQRFGVVGPNGSVGSLCWQMLLCVEHADEVGGITLFYNPDNPRASTDLGKTVKRAVTEWRRRCEQEPAWNRRLGFIAARYDSYRQDADSGRGTDRSLASFIRAVNDVIGEGFLRVAPSGQWEEVACIDRMLIATNRTDELDSLNALAADAAIYDIGFPNTVDIDAMRQGGRWVCSAGLVACPEPWEFGNGNIVELPRGVTLGCFAETLTLAATDPRAVPQGNIVHLHEAEHIGRLARSLGLDPTVYEPPGRAPEALNTERASAIVNA